jgi:hypothetical protein
MTCAIFKHLKTKTWSVCSFYLTGIKLSPGESFTYGEKSEKENDKKSEVPKEKLPLNQMPQEKLPLYIYEVYIPTVSIYMPYLVH